jgi:hypothetical protein
VLKFDPPKFWIFFFRFELQGQRTRQHSLPIKQLSLYIELKKARQIYIKKEGKNTNQIAQKS